MLFLECFGMRSLSLLNMACLAPIAPSVAHTCPCSPSEPSLPKRRPPRFEGEFQAGYAHGLGMFTSEMRGEVYVGEFFAGQRHGCGIKIDMKPFYYLLERGDDPVSAYRKTYDQVWIGREVEGPRPSCPFNS